jgi:hypothetical protein
MDCISSAGRKKLDRKDLMGLNMDIGLGMAAGEQGVR